MYTKKEAFEEINAIQDYYVSKLINKINDERNFYLKEINFTSATGTGKTMMMCKLIERMPEYFFIVTTLSRGQLNLQVKNYIINNCKTNNYQVYGLMDYRINSVLKAEDILNSISESKKLIWIRDEGHIKTNRYEKLLEDKCCKIINFSATNTRSDIKCNFTQTAMLRTVEQKSGSIEDAIKKLVEIKKAHKDVENYNPCAIFRIIKSDVKKIENACYKHKLKYINITNEDFDMSELCKDNNEYDVIINKMKIVEGIDIRRAHVLYMDSKPSNIATRIQTIGRCRRNALLYNDSVDIFAPENLELLKETRKCYVFYDDYEAKVDTDKNGELQVAFCNYITCEDIKPGSVVTVENGTLPNGLILYELIGNSGKFNVVKNEKLGFNYIKPLTDFYKEEIKYNDYSFYYLYDYKIKRQNYVTMKNLTRNKSYISLNRYAEDNVYIEISNDIKEYFKNKTKNLFKADRFKYIKNNVLDKSYNNRNLIEGIENFLEKYLNDSNGKKWIKKMILNTDNYFYTNEAFTKNEKKIYIYCIITKNIKQKDEEIFFQKACSFKSLYCKYTKNKKDDIYNQLYRYLTNLYYKIITFDTFIFKPLRVTSSYNKKPKITKDDIDSFFDYFDEEMKSNKNFFLSYKAIKNAIKEYLNNTYHAICSNIIPTVIWDYSELFDSFRTSINEDETFLAKMHWVSNNDNFVSYYSKFNDIESAIVGTENFYTKDYNFWYENSAISKKIEYNSKMVRFIEGKYAVEISEAKEQLFSGHNSFNIDKKCNSAIGSCVEYYSKYLLYGKNFLYGFLENTKNPGKEEIIRACMQKYRYYMMCAFGEGVAKYIKAFSIEKLSEYKEFVKICIKLGEETALFVKENMYKNIKPENNHNPDLSIKHISGLADYLSENIILDVKVKNNISVKDVYQILAYHYLSTKRSDLKITKLIIFDATSGKNVTINITDNNKSLDNVYLTF